MNKKEGRGRRIIFGSLSLAYLESSRSVKECCLKKTIKVKTGNTRGMAGTQGSPLISTGTCMHMYIHTCAHMDTHMVLKDSMCL